MWLAFITMCLLTSAASKYTNFNQNKSSIFRNDQIIFSSSFNITKILVPTDGSRYTHSAESSEMPSIFFTVSDPKLEGGSCIYVLEGYAAYEVLEGGRDSTADYSFGRDVYFGTRNGIYKYQPDSLSAKKFGVFNDNIIQIQKANATDAIYILTIDRKIYKIETNGTVRTRVHNIVCANEFVLDTSNNIYYVACGDHMVHIVRSDGSISSLTASVIEDFRELKLLRPAFIMENCIPFFGDGRLYILYANGTSEMKSFMIDETPSAYSVDAALYLVAALNGKIYEYNVMDVLLKSMFGVGTDWPKDITKIVMSVIDPNKENSFEFRFK